MANMFDRTATAEDDDLDARARSLDSGPTKRDRPSSEGKPSALDRARGRGYETPKEDPIKKAAAETTTPTEAISTRPPGIPKTVSGSSQPPSSTSDNTNPTGRLPNVFDPESNDWMIRRPDPRQSTGMSTPEQDYPTNTAERPTGMSTPVQDYPTNTAERPTPDEPKPVTSDDEASFRPGPLPKPGVTPPGKGGGGARTGGGGGAPGRRKALGDPTRREAYDPIADRADPRNIAIVDDQGRVNPKLAEKGAIDPTAPGVKTGEAAARYTNNYTNSLAGATSYMENMFHQKKGDPNHAEGYQAMTMGAVGAPDQQTVNGVFKVIDPNNELAPKEKMELATRAMHDWYTSRGDSKSADKVAAEMLQYGNKQAQGYGKQVMMALKNGDRQGAVDGIQKAYDWLPDGYHAEVKNNALTITETATGKTINQLPLDDKQIRNLGLGLASGTLYWDIVGQRAGKPGTFTPPAPQPTQAMATAPPGAAGPSGTPSPAGPASPQAPAAAAPPPSATAPAPPGTPPAAPPPAAAPPPQVTPSSSRPAAPAPAAPGPGTTQQAAPIPLPKPEIAGPQYNTPTGEAPPSAAAPAPTPTQGDGGPPGSPAGQPEKKPDQALAVDTAVPPPLKGSVQPSTTKRPIVAEGDKEKPPGPVRADPDDPDSIPLTTHDGKTPLEPYRRSTVPVTQDVAQARHDINQANRQLQTQQQWVLSSKAAIAKKFNPKDPNYKAGMTYLNQAEKEATSQRNNVVAEYKDVLSGHEQKERANDAVERTRLAPHELSGDKLLTAKEKIDAEFKSVIDNKESKDKKTLTLYANSPLRYADDKKKAELGQLAIKLMEHNRDISAEEAARYVITMTAHVGADKEAEKWSVNGATGAKGSRFVVANRDLLEQPVVVLPDEKRRVILHVPQAVLNNIQQFKQESFGMEEKAVAETNAKIKAANQAKALRAAQIARGEPVGFAAVIPGQLGKTIGMIQRAAERQKENLPPGESTEMKPDEQPPPGMTNAQLLEWQRSQTRKNQAEAKRKQEERDLKEMGVE